MGLTPEQMKATIIRLYDQSNRMNLDVFDEIFSPDFVSYGGAGFKDLRGPEAFKDLYRTFLAAMPDLRFDPTFLVAERDLVFVRGTLSGTHRGDFFMGLAPATGKRIVWTGTAIFRFDERGRSDARWQEWDGLSVMQQMGVVPTPDGQPFVEPSTAGEANPGAANTDPADIAANRALMERFIEEVWNKGNLDVADEIFAPHATSPDAPGLPPGPVGVKVIASMFRNAFPDFRMSIDFMAAEGDRVAAHFVETGTHRGELFGIAPTGKRVSFGEMGLLRLENGLVVESFYNTDMLTLMQQLGVGSETAAKG